MNLIPSFSTMCLALHQVDDNFCLSFLCASFSSKAHNVIKMCIPKICGCCKLNEPSFSYCVLFIYGLCTICVCATRWAKEYRNWKASNPCIYGIRNNWFSSDYNWKTIRFDMEFCNDYIVKIYTSTHSSWSRLVCLLVMLCFEISNKRTAPIIQLFTALLSKRKLFSHITTEALATLYKQRHQWRQ